MIDAELLPLTRKVTRVTRVSSTMPERRLQKSDRIIIIGAGAFGLSTSLHLALRGYKKVKVFDRHDYGASKYDYRSGADSASSGMSDGASISAAKQVSPTCH